MLNNMNSIALLFAFVVIAAQEENRWTGRRRLRGRLEVEDDMLRSDVASPEGFVGGEQQQRPASLGQKRDTCVTANEDGWYYVDGQATSDDSENGEADVLHKRSVVDGAEISKGYAEIRISDHLVMFGSVLQLKKGDQICLTSEDDSSWVNAFFLGTQQERLRFLPTA